MKAQLTAKPHIQYIREIKHLLPEEAFRCNPWKLVYLFMYFGLLFLVYLLFNLTNNIVVYMFLSCLTAHCLSCIGFIAHELSHNSIIKSKRNRYVLEVLAWGLNLIPSTLWDRVHNNTHHTATNTVSDPDRQYFISEKTSGTKIYTRVFYPNRKSMRWNFLVGFHFIPYIFRNIFSVFYASNTKPEIVPFKPKYTGKQKRRISIELCVILALQVGVYNLVGRDAVTYLFAGPLSYLLTSCILMAYIFTNHFLNPITEHSDPLIGTTTVQVPFIFNKLHFNFSYHTEHHVFPSMDSKYYPNLSKILKEKYPDRYNYLPMRDAWFKLWKNQDFIGDDVQTKNLPTE